MNEYADAGLTVMFDSVPVMLGVIRGVSRGDRLDARCLEHGGKRVNACICSGERVTGRQHCLRIAAGELDSAGIVGVGSSVGAKCGDGEVLGSTRGVSGR